MAMLFLIAISTICACGVCPHSCLSPWKSSGWCEMMSWQWRSIASLTTAIDTSVVKRTAFMSRSVSPTCIPELSHCSWALRGAADSMILIISLRSTYYVYRRLFLRWLFFFDSEVSYSCFNEYIIPLYEFAYIGRIDSILVPIWQYLVKPSEQLWVGCFLRIDSCRL